MNSLGIIGLRFIGTIIMLINRPIHLFKDQCKTHWSVLRLSIGLHPALLSSLQGPILVISLGAHTYFSDGFIYRIFCGSINEHCHDAQDKISAKISSVTIAHSTQLIILTLFRLQLGGAH